MDVRLFYSTVFAFLVMDMTLCKITPSSNPFPKINCKNIRTTRKCVTYQRKGFCYMFSNWMEKACARTCNLCRSHVDQSSALANTEWWTWGPWSRCSSTCNDAVRSRRRKCLTTPRSRCTGLPVQKQACTYYTTKCTNTSIDVSTQVLPYPQLSNTICEDLHSACLLYKERLYCILGIYENWMAVHCRKSCGLCGFSEWSPWAPCSVTCGGGAQSKTRICVNPILGCTGRTNEQVPCSSNECPQFSNWGLWSTCDATCGVGRRSRSRTCQNGPGCAGDAAESQSCRSPTNCTLVTEWSGWGSWGSCEVTCGTGERERTRLCLNGPGCVGEATGGHRETENCTMNVKCPEFLPWGLWGSCTATCSGGLRVRTRVCDSTSASCLGIWEDIEPCNTPTCAYFGEWSSWGSCSVLCGDGFHGRTRPCLNGNDCVGNATQKQSCKGTYCPKFSDWTNWSSCSFTCGNSSKTRVRKCLYGTGCLGNTTEHEKCQVPLCPLASSCSDLRNDCARFQHNCHSGRLMKLYCSKTCGFCVECSCFTTWSTWAPCSLTCGGGLTYRSRNCTQTSLQCQKEVKKCNQFICPNDSWGKWTSCSRTCGGGMKKRTNFCGKVYSECPTFYQECETQPCPPAVCPPGQIHRYSDTSACCNTSQNSFCGDPALSKRILGGTKASAKQWPWMVFMFMKNSYGNEAVCGATLISLKWAITAAHCVRLFQERDNINISAGFTEFGVGMNNIQRRKVINVVPYPQFDMPSHDIALLMIEQPFVKTDYVRPICLPNGESTPRDKKCFATGWGRVGPGSNLLSTNLREVSLNVLDLEICRTAFGATIYGRGMNYAMLCAGRLSGGADTCAGDSGGPLVCQRCSLCSWYLAGVTSFGSDSCGLTNHPGVYIAVKEYEEWIRKTVGSSTAENFVGC